MSYELFVSLRHLRVKKAQKFISLNTWISIGGVALGVMALIVVIAVMSGFGKDLRDKILGTNSHIVVTNINRVGMEGYESVIKKIKTVTGVEAASPFIMNQVMLTYGDRVSGIIVRGVDPVRETEVSDLGKYLRFGDLKQLDQGIFSYVEALEYGRGVKIRFTQAAHHLFTGTFVKYADSIMGADQVPAALMEIPVATAAEGHQVALVMYRRVFTATHPLGRHVMTV